MTAWEVVKTFKNVISEDTKKQYIKTEKLDSKTYETTLVNY